jgi:hypothetical protein
MQLFISILMRGLDDVTFDDASAAVLAFVSSGSNFNLTRHATDSFCIGVEGIELALCGCRISTLGFQPRIHHR